MSIQKVESHVYQASCDVCDNGAPKARTVVQAAKNALDEGWSAPVWWNGLVYVQRYLCPGCSPAYLADLDKKEIAYQL